MTAFGDFIAAWLGSREGNIYLEYRALMVALFLVF